MPLTETRQSRTETATYVESGTEPEPGRLVVETSIADPRGVDNSTEAATAVAICNAAVSLGGLVHVSVMEADGTSFVLFRHPSLPEDTCTEVEESRGSTKCRAVTRMWWRQTTSQPDSLSA